MKDLSELAAPFPAEDIEWRVSRSGVGRSGIFCMCLAYITARAIQYRLDAVCGVDGWKNEEPRIIEVNGKSAFVGGISIDIRDHDGNTHWMTKWDVSEPTNIEPAKGGFSGCMKRAGAQWGVGRYLYHLDEAFADVLEEKPHNNLGGTWKYAKLGEKHGYREYWWKAPSLPGWALPKEPEHEISEDALKALKGVWRETFEPENKNPAELREGFSRFVTATVGEFPHGDHTCWTRDAYDKCQARIEFTSTDSSGVSSDVPFEAE